MTAATELVLRDYDDPEVAAHITRVHAAIFNKYDLRDISRYLTEKTYLKGAKYSFKNHEFQQDIANDTSQDINVQKCAQVGMSEMMARYALGAASIMPFFSVIMTMPHAGDATNFAKTRLNPIIEESPDIRDRIDPELNNSEVKGIGSSLLYMRGTGGTTSALSVPADMLIHDEVDRSDPDTLGQYQSRIKHSKWKLTRKFGTPTLDGVGIALAMETSRRKHHMCKCDHCEKWFNPNFHTDVKIPDFEGALSEITKYTLPGIRWQEAVLLCPHCGKAPSLQMDRRDWVIENTDATFDAIGYYVTPFSVPNVVSVPSLVREITKYKTWGEFVNQALGETLSASDSQLVREDIEQCYYDHGSLASTELHCMGIDVGQVCHIVIGRIGWQDDMFIVVHRERVPLAQLQKRRMELAAKFRCLITVIDAFPETNMVHQMQQRDKNLFGAQYHDSKKLADYEVLMVDKNLAEGKLPINLARIHRNVNFDALMHRFKAKTILVQRQPQNLGEDELFIAHCTDMKRLLVADTFGEPTQKWTKSALAEDHYFHALGYCHIACRLLPAASRHAALATLPMVTMLQTNKRAAATIGSLKRDH